MSGRPDNLNFALCNRLSIHCTFHPHPISRWPINPQIVSDWRRMSIFKREVCGIAVNSPAHMDPLRFLYRYKKGKINKCP